MTRLIRIFIFLLLINIFPAKVFSQSLEGVPFGERIFFGGNLGLQFGDQTVIDLNPMAGYKLTEKLSVGVTVTYIYFKFRDPYNVFPSYSSNIYGGSVFTRYFFLENIFAHVEGEVLNLEAFDFNYQLKRLNVFSLYVGGGYRQPLGDRSSLNILLLYNLNEDRNSPYQNPIIRIGFGFGI